MFAVVLALAAAAAPAWLAEKTAPDRLFQRAKQALAQNDLATVHAAAEALNGLAAYEPHRHLLEGMVLLHSNRLLEAVQHFRLANEHPETKGLAYALSGEALYKAKRFRDAQRILVEAIRIDPSYTDARRWLAALYYDIGMMDHALEQLQAVAEQAPADPRPARLRGLIYKDFEAYERAVAEYRESLRRAPNQPDKQAVLVELAYCQLKLGRAAEALETLRRASPTADALALQAECCQLQGDEATAKKLVRDALRLDPKHLGAKLVKAALELADGDPAAAVRTLEKAAEDHPKEYLVRYKLIQAYERAGRKDLARGQVQAMNELRQLRTQFAELHNKAMKDPVSADIRYQLGVLANKLGKPELAYTWFTAALALQPDHPAARQALSEMWRNDVPTGAKAADR